MTFLRCLLAGAIALPAGALAQHHPVTNRAPAEPLVLVHSPVARVVFKLPPFRPADAYGSLVLAGAEACGGDAPKLAPPPRPAEEGSWASGWFSLIALPGDSSSTSCERRWNANAHTIADGLSLGVVRDRSIARPVALALTVDGDTVAPVHRWTEPGFLWDGTTWTSGDAQVRSTFPMSALAPRAGRWPTEIWLTVRVGDGTEYSATQLDAEQRRIVRGQYAFWQVARPGGDVAAVSLRPSQPVSAPVDTALARAARGDAVGGAITAASWRNASPANERSYSGDVATVLMAEVLTRRGEVATASALVAEVNERRPCLAGPAGATGGYRQFAAGKERPFCDIVSPGAVMRRGLLFPGAGHARLRDRTSATIIGGGVASLLASAAVSHRRGERTYSQYLEATSYDGAALLLGDANRHRARARSYLGAGLGLWAADAVVTWYRARSHNARVRNDQL